MSEEQVFNVESLKKSVEQVGRLYPRLVNQNGKILDGNHRTDTDKKWETKVVPTENRFKELLVRAHAHHRRRVPQEETRALIEEMAEALEKNGVPKTEVAVKLVQSLPYSESYTRSLVPDIYKNLLKTQIGQMGGNKTATISEQTVKTQERRTLGRCEGCKTSMAGTILWHGRLVLCPDCIKKADLAPEPFEHIASVKNGQAKILAKIPEAKPQTASQLSTWTHRSESMKVQHGAMENKIVQKLRDKGYKVTTGQKIVVYQVTTEPDWNIELPNRMARGFVDHEFTHGAKQMDRDEELRGLLRKLEPTSLIIGVRVKGDSDKEADEKVAEIEQEMKF